MGGLLAREIARSKILCLMSWGQLSNVTLFFYKLCLCTLPSARLPKSWYTKRYFFIVVSRPSSNIVQYAREGKKINHCSSHIVFL